MTLDIETPVVLLNLQKRWECFRGLEKANVAVIKNGKKSSLQFLFSVLRKQQMGYCDPKTLSEEMIES